MMPRFGLTGILASSMIHVGLFYGFHVLRFEFKPEEPKFISLNFVEVSEPYLPEILQSEPKVIQGRSKDEGIVRLPQGKHYNQEDPMPTTKTETAGIEENVLGERAERDIGEKRNLPFNISGEVSKRGILWKKLPLYPEGLQREATLRFRFFVAPDGSVQNIIPLQKGNPQLEKITTEALYEWRFTSLPPSSQEVQEGVITFIYKLQ